MESGDSTLVSFKCLAFCLAVDALEVNSQHANRYMELCGLVRITVVYRQCLLRNNSQLNACVEYMQRFVAVRQRIRTLVPHVETDKVPSRHWCCTSATSNFVLRSEAPRRLLPRDITQPHRLTRGERTGQECRGGRPPPSLAQSAVVAVLGWP